MLVLLVAVAHRLLTSPAPTPPCIFSRVDAVSLTDIPFSFAYILPVQRFGSAITREQTRVPKKVFAVMGALDGLCGIMQIFASTYLGGSLIILLTQARVYL